MKKTIFALSILGTLISSSVLAQTTSNFQSSAKLESKCTITGQNMSFGQLNLFEVERIALGSITTLCSKGVTYVINPEGGYVTTDSAGRYQFLKNSENDDHLMVAVNFLNASGTWRSWGREGSNGTFQSGLEKLGGTGTGQANVHSIRAVFRQDYSVNSYNSSYTNSHNYNATPGNYSLNMTATIIY